MAWFLATSTPDLKLFPVSRGAENRIGERIRADVEPFLQVDDVQERRQLLLRRPVHVRAQPIRTQKCQGESRLFGQLQILKFGSFCCLFAFPITFLYKKLFDMRMRKT